MWTVLTPMSVSFQIAEHDFPHGLKIDPKIVVGQYIPKTHHLPLQMMNNPRPNQIVLVERAPAAPGIFFKPFDGFEHVSQP